MGSKPGPAAPLTSILLERIRREGPLTFATFMEACLYHPEYGYYTRAPVAEATDYVTSPQVSPLFGGLLGWQFQEMWQQLREPADFHLVEMGAGGGSLAQQILTWSDLQAPRFARTVRYVLVEASPRRRQQAEAILQPWRERIVLCERLPSEAVVGCIFSNEFVDSLPVHRVVQRAEGLREIYVSEREGELAEVESHPCSPSLAEYLERYGVPLTPDQFAEINLAALAWLEQVGRLLERGFLLTIDYGYPARELYGPAHLRGTLLAYAGHRAREDWLACPGEQDLTAHVNFTALIEHGKKVGLAALGYVTQTQFLLALAQATDFADLNRPGASERETLQTRQEFKQLIHPETMGEAFKALLQVKGMEPVPLAGRTPL